MNLTVERMNSLLLEAEEVIFESRPAMEIITFKFEFTLLRPTIDRYPPKMNIQ